MWPGDLTPQCVVWSLMPDHGASRTVEVSNGLGLGDGSRRSGPAPSPFPSLSHAWLVPGWRHSAVSSWMGAHRWAAAELAAPLDEPEERTAAAQR